MFDATFVNRSFDVIDEPMPDASITDNDLLAYLDEMLPVERASQLETELRRNSDLRHRAALLSRRRDQGGHTVGEIWRRHQLSCISRETLGSMLLGVVDPDLEDYIEFHIRTVGCRVCQANLIDLKEQQTHSGSTKVPSKKYFESSAGLFRSQYPPQ